MSPSESGEFNNKIAATINIVAKKRIAKNIACLTLTTSRVLTMILLPALLMLIKVLGLPAISSLYLS